MIGARLRQNLLFLFLNGIMELLIFAGIIENHREYQYCIMRADILCFCAGSAGNFVCRMFLCRHFV